MTESFVLIKENYKDIYTKYSQITGSVAVETNEKYIICDDMRFENSTKKGWCLITLLYGDTFSEEMLLELSDNKLAYFFSDDVQMDCEFLVIENQKILRKKYIYSDTPQLDEDEGKLLCEKGMEFVDWNDIDYFVAIAKENPEKIFK